MYGKIYECTFTGSMMGKGALTFSVWSYVIAHTGPDSLVEINPRLVATLLGEDESKIEEAINYLQEPDPKSRSKTHQGRRLIKRGEYLYFVPNAAKYRGLPNDQARKDYFAQKQREHREGITNCQTGMSKLSKNVKQAEAEAEAISIKQQAEEIYRVFPLKVARPKALKAITEALVKISFPELLAKTKAFASARNGELQYCPHPTTWFNQERYNDDPKTWRNGPAVRQHPDTQKKIDPSKIDLPNRFKSWAGATYPDKREAVMKWQTWADVPESLRQEWWREGKKALQTGDLI